MLNYFIEIKETNDLEFLKLLMAIINSFVLSITILLTIAHPNDIKLILPNSTSLTQKTFKIIMANPSSHDVSFYESCFRLLKSLAVQNLFSIEKCFQNGFINIIEDYLLNDICYQYISSNIYI